MNRTAKAAFHFIPSLHAYHGSDLKHSSKGSIGINVIFTAEKKVSEKGCFKQTSGSFREEASRANTRATPVVSQGTSERKQEGVTVPKASRRGCHHELLRVPECQ